MEPWSLRRVVRVGGVCLASAGRVLLARVRAWRQGRALVPELLREGDLLFQQTHTAQTVLVEILTGCPFTHVGVVMAHEGRLKVLEAWEVVRFQSVEEWAAKGRGRRVAVRRLKDAAPLADPARMEAFRRAGEAEIGKPYDLRFAWGDEAQYCSELVWKLYKEAFGVELAPLVPARTMHLDNPLVRLAIRERFDEAHPFNPEEPVVAPSHLLESPLLMPVEA